MHLWWTTSRKSLIYHVHNLPLWVVVIYFSFVLHCLPAPVRLFFPSKSQHIWTEQLFVLSYVSFGGPWKYKPEIGSCILNAPHLFPTKWSCLHRLKSAHNSDRLLVFCRDWIVLLYHILGQFSSDALNNLIFWQFGLSTSALRSCILTLSGLSPISCALISWETGARLVLVCRTVTAFPRTWQFFLIDISQLQKHSALLLFYFFSFCPFHFSQLGQLLNSFHLGSYICWLQIFCWFLLLPYHILSLANSWC